MESFSAEKSTTLSLSRAEQDVEMVRDAIREGCFQRSLSLLTAQSRSACGRQKGMRGSWRHSHLHPDRCVGCWSCRERRESDRGATWTDRHRVAVSSGSKDQNCAKFR